MMSRAEKHKAKMDKMGYSFSKGAGYVQGFLLRRNPAFVDRKKQANKRACRAF